MSRNNDQISSAQLAAILSITMMGIGILSLPRTLVEAVGPDALFIIIAGVAIVVVVGLIISKLAMKFPKDTIVEFGNTLLGKFMGTAMALGFFAYFILFTAIEVRMFGEIIKTYLLLNTPLEVLMITYMLTVVYVVRRGVEPFARMAQILFPIVLLTSFFVMLPILQELDLTHFLPVLKTPLMKMAKALPLMVFSFLGLELTLLFGPFISDKKNITKYVTFAVLLIGLIYFNTTLVSIARFGLAETKYILWPGLELFKTVDIPGAFIENIHIYVIAIWILSVLMTTVGVYYGASLTLSRIIKSSEQDYLVLPLVPIIYFFALAPDSLVQTMELMDLFSNYMGTLYLILVPVGLLALSFFRKNKGEKKDA